jgi:hypothetical protein
MSGQPGSLLQDHGDVAEARSNCKFGSSKREMGSQDPVSFFSVHGDQPRVQQGG